MKNLTIWKINKDDFGFKNVTPIDAQEYDGFYLLEDGSVVLKNKDGNGDDCDGYISSDYVTARYLREATDLIGDHNDELLNEFYSAHSVASSVVYDVRQKVAIR